MAQLFSDRARRGGVVRVGWAIEVNGPYLARCAIISENASRRGFLLRAFAFQQRGATPVPSF